MNAFDPFYPESQTEIAEIAKQVKFIPGQIFTEVRQWSNTPTADFIPTRYGPNGFEFLLTKRKEKPWAGQWFFSGGRIVPGDTPNIGLQKNCQRELGFIPEIHDTKFLLWQSIFNPECEHGGTGYFAMSACWQIWVDYNQPLKLDSTLSDLRWFTEAEAREMVFSTYVAEAIKSLHKEPARNTQVNWEAMA